MFQNILCDVDRVLYVDTDVIFQSSVSKIWKEFDNFNSLQIAALARESENFKGVYDQEMSYPVPQPSG